MFPLSRSIPYDDKIDAARGILYVIASAYSLAALACAFGS